MSSDDDVWGNLRSGDTGRQWGRGSESRGGGGNNAAAGGGGPSRGSGGFGGGPRGGGNYRGGYGGGGGNHYGGRGRTRSPDRFGRPGSRSPPHRFGGGGRHHNRMNGLSPKLDRDAGSAAAADSMLNPVVMTAFQRLISNATLGMGKSDEELMSFKQFIFNSEENFDEDTAIKKYAEYKREFKNSHLIKFFDAHKSYEWFKRLYDADLHGAQLAAGQEATKKRYDVFMYLMNELNIIKGQPVEIGNQAKLNEILDSAAIMIEGGSIENLGEINQMKRSGIAVDAGQKSATGGSVWNQFVGNDNNNKPEEKSAAENADAAEGNEAEKMEVENDHAEQEEVKESYHKTASIFVKDFPETLKQSELEAFASNYAGFKRVYVQNPILVKKWAARAWITFNCGVDIAQICADFNKHTFSNGESLVGLVNRDLEFRIRPVSGISSHRDIMKKDLLTAIKLVLLYDEMYGLHGTNVGTVNEKPNLNNLKVDSGNPLLANVAPLIVDEADYEEEMGEESANAGSSKKTIEMSTENDPFKSAGSMPLIKFESDKELKDAFDPIVLYLRIVHSIDFYSTVRIPRESSGPHVIGLFHSRSEFVNEHINKKDADEYHDNHTHKIKYLLRCEPYLEQQDIDYAEFRDADKFVADFIAANSREITQEKWKCLICEKKFRDSPFLTKHINNKHGDVLDTVRHDCALFNNYLRDPQRPGVFIQGVGKLTSKFQANDPTLNGTEKSLEQATKSYKNAVSSLSVNPVLMATFINQAIASANVNQLPGGTIGSGNRFNQMQERRSITSYTDVDNQN